MGYLSGQGAALTLGGEGWEGDITRIRHKQTLDNTQIKVMGQAFANTVTGAYHTVYVVEIATADDLAATDLEVGTAAALNFTYATGPDKLALASAVVTDIEVTADVEGAILATLEIQGNGAMAHTVT